MDVKEIEKALDDFDWSPKDDDKDNEGGTKQAQP